MISVVYKKDHSLEMFGHANHDEHGKDIVCASASSIIITTVNAMIRINDNAIEYKQDENKITIKITDNDDVIIKLFQNGIELLIELSHQYPKNIKIREEEI